MQKEVREGLRTLARLFLDDHFSTPPQDNLLQGPVVAAPLGFRCFVEAVEVKVRRVGEEKPQSALLAMQTRNGTPWDS